MRPDISRRTDSESEPDPSVALPNPTSKEVLAVQAYLTWLAKGYAVGQNPSWRGQNAIERDKLIPVDKLDTARGQAVYLERCQSCHGPEGQGVQIGDKKAGPLWGPDSWNDGAGAARVYTLAGIVRYSMPYLDPGSLSDADAQNVAAFINSQTRPHYPFKRSRLHRRQDSGGRPLLSRAGTNARRHEMIVQGRSRIDRQHFNLARTAAKRHFAE